MISSQMLSVLHPGEQHSVRCITLDLISILQFNIQTGKKENTVWRGTALIINQQQLTQESAAYSNYSGFQSKARGFNGHEFILPSQIALRRLLRVRKVKKGQLMICLQSWRAELECFHDLLGALIISTAEQIFCGTPSVGAPVGEAKPSVFGGISEIATLNIR